LGARLLLLAEPLKGPVLRPDLPWRKLMKLLSLSLWLSARRPLQLGDQMLAWRAFLDPLEESGEILLLVALALCTTTTAT